MSKLILSKSGLQEQRENMRLYERVLPSLELKRMQLTAELKRAQEHLIHSKTDAERFRQELYVHPVIRHCRTHPHSDWA